MSVEKPQFNAIKYTTKDGENITATKQDGIVTLVGDKNGVRQMPLNQFMQEFVQNVPQINNGQPKNDTVSFSGQPDKTLDGAKNSKKGLLATLGLLLLAGGAYVLTRGRNSKAAKVAQEAGQEIIEQGAKKGSKAVQEVAEEVVPKGKKVATEVAEEVTTKGKKVATEVVEEALPTGQKVVTEAVEEVASKGKPVVQGAGKAGTKKGKDTGEVVAETAERLQQKIETEALKREAVNQLEALGFIVDDAVPANKVADEIVESTKKQIDGVLDNTSLPKVEIPKAEVPEIKIPRQAFEQGGDNAGKLVKDALDDVADDAGKLADEALDGVTPRGSSVVENVTDEGAEAAQKLFGDNSPTGIVDDALHNPTSFVDDAVDYADDIYKHGTIDSVDDFATHTDDMFTQHTDDMFAQHTDDLFATHTDDMFGQNVDNMFEPHNFDGGLF